MKKLLPLLGAMLLVASSVYSEIVKEVPIGKVGAATTVSVSTSAWTKVPTTSTLTQRAGVLVNNPASNTAVMSGIISTSTVVPGEATTVRPLAFAPSTDFTFVPVDNNMRLYLISIHTSSESVHVQEVGQ